jgi:hypothetical protein
MGVVKPKPQVSMTLRLRGSFRKEGSLELPVSETLALRRVLVFMLIGEQVNATQKLSLFN